MARPKEGEKMRIGTNIRVKLDPNNLHMVGGSGAYQFIIRVVNVALRIPDFGFDDARESLKG